MTQLQFNFDKSRQLEIPFSQWPSFNQEATERAKDILKSHTASDAEKLDAQAELERLRQTTIQPQQ